MRKVFTFLLATAFAAIFAVTATAQAPAGTDTKSESAKPPKLQITGYIQGQYQWGGEAASLKVGAPNETLTEPFSRLGIRRGRIKFAYGTGIGSAVFQLDITEKGLGLKDAYLSIKDPWMGAASLKAGVFDRPFGYEISYSSSRRESPERSTVFQTLFPDERDLGAMLTLQALASSLWNILKLEAGLFAGNGIKPETDSKRDFIGHLSAAKDWRRVSFGAGVSYYNGKVAQGTPNVFTLGADGFTANSDPANEGRFAKREYVGFDARVSFRSLLGSTRITAEYIFGRQPGTANGSKSPNSATLIHEDTYLRDFGGGYVMLVHEIARTPVGIVAKYDRYDPNTKISGNDVGRGGKSAADLWQSTLGVGALWNVNPDIRLTAYYEFNTNEKAPHLPNFSEDINNDVFTLRLQYKF